jgi:hypothetical protein
MDRSEMNQSHVCENEITSGEKPRSDDLRKRVNA